MRRFYLIAALIGSLALFDVGTAQTAASSTAYRVGGASALRPAQIWDDGVRTYIVWRPETELPAVFSIGSDGREMLTDGQMHGDQYVLGRVHSKLVFRIDHSFATASRKVKQ